MIKLSLKTRRITALIAAMIGVATMHFNCAPSLFEGADNSAGSGGGGSGLQQGQDLFSSQKTSPWVLQNTFQVFSSFANVTGQNLQISNTQLQEYDARTGALSQTDKLSDVNAPLQLAATSLAGEFCSGLITRETAAGATRKYFNGVNFGAGLAQNNATSFGGSIAAMAQGFWGRSIKPEEETILNAYYTDFVATAGTAAAQTRNLYLSTCAAMLASFDTLTY